MEEKLEHFSVHRQDIRTFLRALAAGKIATLSEMLHDLETGFERELQNLKDNFRRPQNLKDTPAVCCCVQLPNHSTMSHP